MPYTSNKKINALDLAPAPLGDNDAVPMVRSGVTFQTPLSAVEAKVFSSKTAISGAPLGTETVVLRQGDGSLRQTTTSNLLPNGSITNTQIGASAAIADTKLATIATAGKVSNSATTASSANVINTIVARDGSGNFSAGTITANLTGNSAGTHTGPVVGNTTTATTLATPRAISLTGAVTATGVNFDGSANISLNTAIAALPDSALATVSTAGKVSGNAITSGTIGGSTAINTSGTITSGAITANLTGTVTGNASTATALQTARTIAISGDATGTATSFNGSANITIPLTLTPGIIVDADVSATAAIADTKLSTISTAGKVSGAAITSGTIGGSTGINTTGTVTASAISTGGTVTATSFVGSGASLTGITPAGAVMHFARATAPTGWLVANGNAVPNGNGTVQGVTADFSSLYAALGTSFGAAGTLPNLGGIFIRGSGSQIIGGITYAATLGTAQGDAFQAHQHTVGSGTGSGGYANFNSNSPQAIATSTTATVTDGANGTPRTASETRPANQALLPCIKY